jgi:hypothetical protein
MKLFFFALIFVLLCNSNNALRCVNETDEKPFEASQLLQVKNIVDNLTTSEGYEVCSILFGVMYPDNTFVVQFGIDTGELSVYTNRYVFYQMELIMSSGRRIIDPASGLKSFVFTCDDQDDCERQFWRDHIDWFVRDETTALEAALRPILITKIQNQGKIAFSIRNREIL